MDEIKNEGNPNNDNSPRKKFFRKKNLTIMFTAVIAVITAIYTLFSYLQWTAMRDAIQRADSSNVYTRETLELTRNNFIIENRAWIGFENSPDVLTDNWMLRAHIKNLGKTPANHLNIWTYGFFSNKEVPKVYKTIFFDSTAIAPNGTYPVEITPTYPKGKFIEHITSSAWEQKTFVYYHIRIIYGDVYNGKDTTEFIFRAKATNSNIWGVETIYSKMK